MWTTQRKNRNQIAIARSWHLPLLSVTLNLYSPLTFQAKDISAVCWSWAFQYRVHFIYETSWNSCTFCNTLGTDMADAKSYDFDLVLFDLDARNGTHTWTKPQAEIDWWGVHSFSSVYIPILHLSPVCDFTAFLIHCSEEHLLLPNLNCALLSTTH